MITEAIYAHALATPQRRAIVWNGVPVSYGRLAQAVESLRTTWKPLALPPGSVAVVVVHSLLDCWTAVLALQSLGLVTVCVRALKEADALALRKVSCVLLCHRKAETNRADLALWPHARHLELPPTLFGASATLALSAPASFTPGGGHILCTSGTTGTPKKIFHDASMDTPRCVARAALEGLDARTVLNTVNLGLWTSIGYCRPLPVWHAGGCMVFDQTAQWPQHLGDHGVTHFNTVTGMLQEAVQALEPGAARHRGWQFKVAVGGSFLSPALAQLARERLAASIGYTYASTELWLATMRTQVSMPQDLQWLQPWGERELQTVTEAGEPCADGEEGLLRVRLMPLDYHGYLDDPDNTSRMFRDGWFYPGDLAIRRADGRFRILGRVADVINVNGVKMASGPIEETVRTILDANAVCAFSGPGPHGDDVIVLAVETLVPIGRERLQQAVDQLASIARARFVQLPRFPRNQAGTHKIDRITLRRRVMSMQPHPPSPP